MLNVASATPLTPGTTISNPDNPGNATFLYSFNATQGVPIDLTTNDPSNSSRCGCSIRTAARCSGRQQTGQQLFTPTVTGVYTVMMEGRV